MTTDRGRPQGIPQKEIGAIDYPRFTSEILAFHEEMIDNRYFLLLLRGKSGLHIQSTWKRLGFKCCTTEEKSASLRMQQGWRFRPIWDPVCIIVLKIIRL